MYSLVSAFVAVALYYLGCRYHGHRQARYIVRSTFGGLNDRFIASGSEDSLVSFVSQRWFSQLLLSQLLLSQLLLSQLVLSQLVLSQLSLSQLCMFDACMYLSVRM